MRWIGQITYDEVSYFREDVIIEADNKLGIGTFSPSEKLHVVGDALITGDSLADAFKPAAAGEPIKFKNFGGTERARILDGGNVGIGTTSPDTYLQIEDLSSSNLEVDLEVTNTHGSARFGTQSGYTRIWADNTLRYATAGAVHYWYSDGAVSMTLLHSGNLGIGTTAPSAKLTVDETTTNNLTIAHFKHNQSAVISDVLLENSAGGNNSGINLNFKTASSGYGGKISVLRTNSPSAGAADMILSTSGGEAVTIKSTGDVGIGTTSPSAKLDLVNGSSFSSDVDVFNLTLNKTGGTAVTNVKGVNLNIGSNDHVAGNDITNLYGAYINNSTTGGSASVISNWYGVYVPAADADRVSNRVSAYFGDNVGIGTTSPASLLHVAGTVQVGVDDTGHDVIFYGATSGRYLWWDESEDALKLRDNTTLKIGSGSDLQIKHDGSNGYISQYDGGNLYIQQNVNDADLVLQCDNGSGGVTPYLTLDGSSAGITVSAPQGMAFFDDVKAKFGNADDLSIHHDGSNSLIDNITGHLYIYQKADDKNISFQCDDGSGGNTEYLRFDGTAGHTVASKEIHFLDNVLARFGSTNDFAITHNGTNTTFENGTGNLVFSNYADDADVIFQSDDGSGGVTPYLTLDGSTTHSYFSAGNVGIGTASPQELLHLFQQNHSNPLLIEVENDGYLAGTSAGIKLTSKSTDGVSGSWTIDNLNRDTLRFLDDGSEKMRITSGGNVGIGTTAPENLLTLVGTAGTTHQRFKEGSSTIGFIGGANGIVSGHNGKLMLRAEAGLILSGQGNGTPFILDSSGNTTLRGTLTVGINDTGHDVKFFGATSGKYMLWDEDNNGGTLILSDNVYFRLGNSNDLYFWHTGADTKMQNNTGDLYIKNDANDKDIIFQCDDGSGGVTTYIHLDGSAARTVFSRETQHSDNVKGKFGSSGDLQIYHDGSNSYIDDAGTGNLKIRSNRLQLEKYTGETMAEFIADGGSSLYYNNSKKLETVTGGVNITGELEADSLDIDGVAQIDGALTVGVNDTGHDVKFFGATSGKYMLWDESADRLLITDNTYLALGSASDVLMYHDGSNSHINNYTGNLTIHNSADDGDIIFQSDDGSGGVETYFYLDGSISSGNPFTVFPDSSHLAFGDSQDLQIDHDGNHSVIYNKTGHLYISNDSNDGDIVLRSDDGSGGVTAYLTLDGGDGHTIANKEIQFVDGVPARFGSGNDMAIRHTGSHSFVSHDGTGNLYIDNTADDAETIFRCDDGSGGTTAYLTLDGSGSQIHVAKSMRFPDSIGATWGTGNDLEIFHNGTYSNINNKVGHLYIDNSADDSDIIFRSDDGSGGVETYFFLDGSDVQTRFLKDLRILDDVKLLIGNGSDLKIYHNGSDSYIDQQGTGNLIIRNTTDDADIIFQSDDGSGGVTAYLTLDGSATQTAVHKDLRFDNNIGAVFGSGAALKLHSDGSNGIIDNYQGNLIIRQQVDNADIGFQSDNGAGGVATYFSLDGSAATHDGSATTSLSTTWPDKSQVNFGSGRDTMLYHDGSNMTMYNFTGDLLFYNGQDDGDITFYCDNGSGGTTAYLTLDGSVGHSIASKAIRFNDSVEAFFGSSDDLKVIHNGSHSYVSHVGTGDLYLQNTTDDGNIILRSDNGSGGVTPYITLDGGDVSTTVDTIKVLMPNLPTSDPSVAGQLYHVDGDLKISLG